MLYWIYMKSYTEIKKEFLKDPAFRKAYEELGPEFELASMIIEKRLRKGLTQKALAKKIGTQQSAIARLESGDYNPTIAFLEKVSKALGARLSISLG